VLDIAHIEAGGMDIRREPVQVQQLMDRALLLFGGEALDKGLSLKSMPCAQWVLGDRLALQRIISNLVANAVRHTHEGRVLMGARRRGDQLRVMVLDTGPGIAVASQARIFEEFYRLPTTTGHGFGLGLATVKRLCDAAGYTLGFDSVPGRGSAFWVQLARVAAPLPDFPSTAPSPLEPVRAVGQGMTVLLVEDDPGARGALETTLRGWGHFCVSAESFDAALARVASQPPNWDVVISDFDLPNGQNGLQLIAAVRAATNATLPAVLISGTMNPALRAKAEGERCIALPKPVRPLQLRAVLGQIGAR
jgi:CheY-like chemotaxis protein